MNRSSCGCGYGASCGCGCGCGGGNHGAVTLPSFPACPVWPQVEPERPVYVSFPASSSRGNASFSAEVEMTEDSCGCGWARG